MTLSQFLVVFCYGMVSVTMATSSTHEGGTCKLMTTYNTGLMPNIGQIETRKSGITEALKNTDDDFMCLQEVWFEKDMAALLDGLKTVFPHHYSKIHAEMDILRDDSGAEEDTTKDTPCTASESQIIAGLLGQCGYAHGCLDIADTIQQGFCMVTHCGHLLKTESVRESCISCVFLFAPMPLQDSLRQCTAPRPVHNRLNGPGLLILSKTELLAANYTKYFPNNRMALERGYIEARLNDSKTVACTHLSTIYPIYFDFDLEFGSYENQSKAEMTVLDRAFRGRKHIVMGDFNAGPNVTGKDEPEKNLEGELASSFDLFLSFGYRSVYLEEDGRCTHCVDNPIKTTGGNNVLDHVFVRNNDFKVDEPRRVFDASSPPLSDHYGVQVRVCDFQTAYHPDNRCQK